VVAHFCFPSLASILEAYDYNFCQGYPDRGVIKPGLVASSWSGTGQMTKGHAMWPFCDGYFDTPYIRLRSAAALSGSGKRAY
jgi:hypothetical protein